MNKLFIIALIIAIAASQTYSTTACGSCAQLLSQGDCSKMTGCSWDSTKNTCGTATTPVTPTVTYAAYCDSFAEADCPKAEPCQGCGKYAACAWDGGKCVQFTGCTPYAKSSDSECQAISNRCITDGTHCVEIDSCSTYTKQLPCVKNTTGTLCYWDSTNNTCVDANTCDKLPASYTTDAECRAQISTCTTKTGGGCVDSGTNCSDQLLEIQCVWNKVGKTGQKCYWDTVKLSCVNKTCDAAPSTLVTDDACKAFLDDGTCTTKSGGGCVVRGACTDVIQAACVKNVNGGDCYWNTLTSKCVEKICNNAPTSMTTNLACSGFAPTPANGCIAKSGGGCITNGACAIATMQSACTKNSSGVDCIWDTVCKEKTCANAPTSNNTHELCTSYSSTCTVKTGGGCQPRTCSNAPTSITTNEACEAYLPNYKCITVQNGGCITNTTCAIITYKPACVKDANNTVCFYDDASSSCKDKICTNAPSSNNTHELCQAFLASCTVNSSSNGCVSWTCENSLAQANCTQDTNQKPCIWKGKCYQKQCALAPSTTSTHSDCNSYLSSCTLSNTGAGCVPIPLKCEAITLEAACVRRQSGAICGWNGTGCIDKACSTAPKTTTTTTDCNSYLSGCVSANPVSGSVSGCIDLPATCAARLSDDNCSRGSSPVCLWNTSTSKCVEKTCDIATVDGTPGKVVASDSTCNSFLTGCLVSDDLQKCIPKVTSCSSLHSAFNCIKTAKVTGYCFWNGTTCVDLTCTNINKTSNFLCNSTLDSCTVNAGQTACMALATSCINYTIQDQCVQNSAGKLCVWTGTACRNATCYDADNTGSFNTDDECSKYAAVSDTCAVVYKVGGQGCVPKAAQCSDYYISAQCHQTLSNSSGVDDCIWINNACYAKSTYATGDCSTFKGTQATCELYRLGCTNTGTATSTTPCTFDCSKKIGSSLTHSQCSQFNSTCTSGNGATTCQASNAACSGYISSTTCTYNSSGAKCYWNTSGTPACIQITTALTDCQKVTGTSLTHDICQSYNTGCTMASATACQQAATCSSYTSANCTYNTSGKKCFLFTDDESVAKCIDITASSDCASVTGTGLTYTSCSAYDSKCHANSAGTACVLFTSCALITGTGLTDTLCAGFDATCTVNATGTACQIKNTTGCSSYTTSTACSIATASNTVCLWNTSTAAGACEDASPTNCAYKIGTGLTASACSTLNSACTVNATGTACQIKNTTGCSSYTTSTACSIATASNTVCLWNTSTAAGACEDASATNCAYKIGTGLTASDCSTLNSACTVNATGTACQIKASTGCSDYTTSTACSIAATGNIKCIWNTGTAACVVASTNCALKTGTGLSANDCSNVDSACTVNATGTACQIKNTTGCSSYTTSTACSFATASNTVCLWNTSTAAGACEDASATNCAYKIGTGLTDTICNNVNAACTVNSAKTACQVAQKCTSYTDSATCTFNPSSVPCIWYNSKCIIASSVTDCAKISGQSSLTDSICQTYNASCKAASATACYLVTQCTDQPSSTLCGTVGTTKCYWYNTSSCIAIATSSDCVKVTAASGLTFETCQSYNAACSVNRAGTSCIAIQPACTGYGSTVANCVKSTAGVCVGDTSCQAASTATTCETIVLGAGRYTNDNCNAAKSGCTNKTDSSGCTARTCANFTGTASHTNCNAWLNTCTANANSSPTGCVTMGLTCSAQAGTAATCLQTTEGACVLSGTNCVKKTCDTADASSSFNTDSLCSGYSSGCTVARIGGCQPRGACSSYKSQLQCYKNTSNQSCFWNPTLLTCVDLSCGTIEASTSFDSHSECYNVDSTLKCTVRASNGAIAAGCMARQACNLYTIEEQCEWNANGGECVWDTNKTPPQCADIGCTTAPNTTATHNDCYSYFSSVTPKVFCTVVATASTSGGAPTLGGCQQTAACNSYIAEEQCVMNANGDLCGWNGTACNDKSCATAKSTVNTDTLCRAYLSTCTVTDTGSGCMEIPTDCSGLGTQNNCVSNKAGALCYWTGSACQTRTCDNAPDSTASADDCNTHLSGCTLDNTKCKTKICEDFVFTTDTLCKQALQTCTSDGTKCVTRGTCYQALNEAGCVTAAPVGGVSKACQWVAATGTAVAYCTEKNCTTAPVATFTTEAQCAGYFTDCTTKSGGGCVKKSTCNAATAEAACTTALDGTVCQWDTNACRNKDCQDFSGTTHAACLALRSGCTAGLNGKCAKQKNCEDTTVRAACIQGSNGPCLWVNDYANTDGSTGACFSYTSCKSLKWNDDDLCKLASKKCTTDGSKCVGITLCSETNTSGGCVTGYDGDCIQSISSLTSTDPAVCKAYTSCADAFYLTHAACQNASMKCTTNGSTGCIPLAACSTYAKEGCVYNNVGPVTTNGAVTSTGYCHYDEGGSCRDENCQDLTGTTHSQCYSQLSTCTSDGTNCLVKGNCSTYTTQTACTTALGADGTCYWEAVSATNTTAKCRLMTCDDIANGTSTAVCSAALSSCVSDGTNCIAKATCSTYKTKTSCNSAGSDGICVFAASTVVNATAGSGSCSLMSSCTTANSDQIACAAAKDRCKWTASVTNATTNSTTASSCATHNCASYQQTNGACSKYLSWDKKLQQICTVVNGTCTATDPSTLSSSDCYSISGYTYTWSSTSSKCQVCTAVVTPNNTNTTNNTNNTNGTTTTSGYILGFASVVLGYLVF